MALRIRPISLTRTSSVMASAVASRVVLRSSERGLIGTPHTGYPILAQLTRTPRFPNRRVYQLPSMARNHTLNESSLADDCMRDFRQAVHARPSPIRSRPIRSPSCRRFSHLLHQLCSPPLGVHTPLIKANASGLSLFPVIDPDVLGICVSRTSHVP